MTFEPSRILVTGGAGFIGANFTNHLLTSQQVEHVIVLDALTYAGNIENLKPSRDDPRLTFVHGDICDEALVSKLFKQHQLDTVVHFAAESHVDRSILGPDEFIRTNVIGTHSLLKAAKAAWVDSADKPAAHRFHHVSTDEVYGSLATTDDAFSETTRYTPNSPYSASKAASDHLVRAYHETYGLSVITTNCSNNYGPFQFPEKLVPLLILNVLHGKPIPIYGDGMQVRDWLHVADHCIGIELALKQGATGEVYNLGGGCEIANLDLAMLVCTQLDEILLGDESLRTTFPLSPAGQGRKATSLIIHVRDRPGHDRRYAIDFRKAHNVLGYSPAQKISDGLRDTINWYLGNMDWWSPLLGADYAEWIAANYGDE